MVVTFRDSKLENNLLALEFLELIIMQVKCV